MAHGFQSALSGSRFYQAPGFAGAKSDFNHSNKALDKECAAGVYSASPRRLTAEELEFILVHEEPRKVLKTGAITYYGQYYKVPDAYIGRRVWTKLKGDTLLIESAKKVIAEHQIRHDRFDEPL